jgi:hypothetical protein
MRNIEIEKLLPHSVSLPTPIIVVDRSVRESTTGPIGQEIRITFNNAQRKDGHISSTLGFDAERMSWKDLIVEASMSLEPIFTFHLKRRNSPSGFLSITTDQTIISTVYKQTARSVPRTSSDWSLVRLHQLQLEPLEQHLQDELQCVINEMEPTGQVTSAQSFREALQKSKVLHVLLIRRRGIYWERMGSGLMIEEHWPSTDSNLGIRAYQERFVLI